MHLQRGLSCHRRHHPRCGDLYCSRLSICPLLSADRLLVMPFTLTLPLNLEFANLHTTVCSSPTVITPAWHYTPHRSRHRNLGYSLWICLWPQLNAPNSVPVVLVCSFVDVSSLIRTVHNVSLPLTLHLYQSMSFISLCMHTSLSLSLLPSSGFVYNHKSLTVSSLLVLSATPSSRTSFSLDLLHDPFRSLC
jgi:hypothetical protein